MAVSKNPNPNIIPSYNTDNPGTGTGGASCLRCHQIRFGKMVFLSARVMMNWNIPSDAPVNGLNTPLLTLDINVPDYNPEIEIPIPSLVKVGGNAYTDLCSIQKINNKWYAMQKVSSSLSKDDIVEFFMVYQAV